ncbi:hypothetical protein ACFLZC_00805 [Patescibacteria group bacterium]
MFERPITKKEASEESEKIETAEYLRPDIKPIMACIGTLADFKHSHSPHLNKIEDAINNESRDNSTTNVDYFGSPMELQRQGFKNRGKHSYVISTIDNKDKFSHNFINCTGIIVTGKDRETGKNVSFLSHQDPEHFLREEEDKKQFAADLRERTEELKKRCEDGTIDARIIGGNYFGEDRWEYDRYQEDYLKSIKLLSSESSDILGFEPAIVVGPKTVSGKDDVFYDNENRRLYIIRPVVGDASSESFLPQNIEEQEKKWLE